MLIDYKHVNVNQESLEVLNDVNLEIDKGEFVYIIGKVGSGKSSLLKTMYGELPIKEGDAQVLNFNIKKLRKKRLPKLRKKLGIIFQDFQLLTDRTVEANLRFVLQATGWKNKHEIRMRIEEVLNLVGMSTKGYKYPNELSGGEQQRISIARAILNNPEIILADEPTGNLDVETGNRICELLHKICEKGSTVVMVTHNIRLLDLYPGRVFQCLDHKFTEITQQETREETSNEEIYTVEDDNDVKEKDDETTEKKSIVDTGEKEDDVKDEINNNIQSEKDNEDVKDEEANNEIKENSSLEEHKENTDDNDKIIELDKTK